MNIIELIKSRRAVRNFSSKSLDEAIIKKVLTAGQYAPSPLNSQPWHFTLIRNKTSLKNLASTAKHAGFLADAPLLIIVSVNQRIEIDDWLIKHRQHVYSGAAAMQNMWLTSWSLGLGCCWVTLDESTTKHIISLPDDHELIGGLALGHIEEKRMQKNEEKDRKALSEMTSFEIYGIDEACEAESCRVCLKMVPKSAASSPEGEDYLRHYCGLDCYAKWRKKTKKGS
jgi:nitroreductase